MTTNVYLTAGYGAAESAQASDEESPESRTINLAQLPKYAAVDPRTQRPYRDGVVRVDVQLPSPLLATGLTLIDTPGVDGLIAGHTAITLPTYPGPRRCCSSSTAPAS